MNEASQIEPPAAGHNRPRNAGAPLDPAWFEPVGVNASAVERRAASLPARRSVKKEFQAAWLVQRHHLHRSDDAGRRRHAGRVRRLCAKARRPLERRARSRR